MRVAGILACVLVCAWLAGCGSVGEPLYPALNLPSRVTDLAAVERGDKIVISFGIPPLTTDGMALKSIGSIDLRIGQNPDPGGAFNTGRWAASATRVDVAAPLQPGMVTASAPVGDWIGKEVFIAVRVGNAKGRMSEWSNVVNRTLQPPLESPTGFRVTPVAEGVRLQWTAPGQSKFRIYRRAEGAPMPVELATTESSEYVDTSIEYGKRYEYFVQGLSGETESDVASLAEPITPKDVFPPATPTGVTASTGIGTIEVAWERNTESDFKEYRVYRSTEDGPFDRIAEGLAGPSYSDSKIESGKRYRYQITAVDQVGNESPRSMIVEASAP